MLPEIDLPATWLRQNGKQRQINLLRMDSERLKQRVNRARNSSKLETACAEIKHAMNELICFIYQVCVFKARYNYSRNCKEQNFFSFGMKSSYRAKLFLQLLDRVSWISGFLPHFRLSSDLVVAYSREVKVHRTLQNILDSEVELLRPFLNEEISESARLKSMSVSNFLATGSVMKGTSAFNKIVSSYNFSRVKYRGLLYRYDLSELLVDFTDRVNAIGRNLFHEGIVSFIEQISENERSVRERDVDHEKTTYYYQDPERPILERYSSLLLSFADFSHHSLWMRIICSIFSQAAHLNITLQIEKLHESLSDKTMRRHLADSSENSIFSKYIKLIEKCLKGFMDAASNLGHFYSFIQESRQLSRIIMNREAVNTRSVADARNKEEFADYLSTMLDLGQMLVGLVSQFMIDAEVQSWGVVFSFDKYKDEAALWGEVEMSRRKTVFFEVICFAYRFTHSFGGVSDSEMMYYVNMDQILWRVECGRADVGPDDIQAVNYRWKFHANEDGNLFVKRNVSVPGTNTRKPAPDQFFKNFRTTVNFLEDTQLRRSSWFYLDGQLFKTYVERETQRLRNMFTPEYNGSRLYKLWKVRKSQRQALENGGLSAVDEGAELGESCNAAETQSSEVQALVAQQAVDLVATNNTSGSSSSRRAVEVSVQPVLNYVADDIDCESGRVGIECTGSQGATPSESDYPIFAPMSKAEQKRRRYGYSVSKKKQ